MHLTRVMLQSSLAVCALDLVGGRVLGNTEHVVGIDGLGRLLVDEVLDVFLLFLLSRHLGRA